MAEQDKDPLDAFFTAEYRLAGFLALEVGLAGDPTLADYLAPFLQHVDPDVRSEAFEANTEQERVREHTERQT